ncbi:hypothetical protein BN9982_20001 [Mycobacterium tuberculosis]|nr:hypothetical protein BN9982_20001 [Mycobacterium tuberculosis]
MPERLAATGLLHHDGSAPDVSGLRQVGLTNGDGVERGRW